MIQGGAAVGSDLGEAEFRSLLAASKCFPSLRDTGIKIQCHPRSVDMQKWLASQFVLDDCVVDWGRLA